MRLLRAPAYAFVVLLLLAPSLATASPPPPNDFSGRYDTLSHATTLSWTPPNSALFTYYLWRDGQPIGESTGTTFMDRVPQTVPDYGIVYFVSAAPVGNPENIGLPAVVGVPTISCEIVTISSSWQYPHLHVHLHQECVGGITYDKDVTWTAP